MQTQLATRLTELRSEFEKGQQRLKEIEAETNALHDTLLRISGAIQVLEEELEKVYKESYPNSGTSEH